MLGVLSFVYLSPEFSRAWYDKTHIAVAKVAGYYKWLNACGADMAKLKAGSLEAHNHYVKNPPGTVVAPEIVLAKVEKYNTVDEMEYFLTPHNGPLLILDNSPLHNSKLPKCVDFIRLLSHDVAVLELNCAFDMV